MKTFKNFKLISCFLCLIFSLPSALGDASVTGKNTLNSATDNNTGTFSLWMGHNGGVCDSKSVAPGENATISFPTSNTVCGAGAQMAVTASTGYTTCTWNVDASSDNNVEIVFGKDGGGTGVNNVISCNASKTACTENKYGTHCCVGCSP